MKTVRLPDGGFPFSSLGASPDLSLACIQFGPFYECAVFGEIIVHRPTYFKLRSWQQKTINRGQIQRSEVGDQKSKDKEHRA